MFQDRQIICSACGQEFTFTAEEQEFFHGKGFQDPRKCKPCRQAAKASRGGGRGGGGGRELHPAVCAGCGAETMVPFRPSGDRPVYCRACYQDVGG